MFHATVIQLALVLELDARLVVFVTGFLFRRYAAMALTIT